MPDQQGPIQEDPFTTFNFYVQLYLPDTSQLSVAKPLCHMEFSELDGLEMTMEPKTVREGGNNTQQIHLVGPVTYGNLTLKRGMTSSQDLWTWFTAATSTVSRGLKAGAVIDMCDGKGNTKVRFTVLDCLPIKVKAPALNAKDGIIAIEELQIAYGSFKIEPGGRAT